MRAAGSWLVIANFANTGAKVLVFVVLARFGGIAVAGAYTLALSIITPTFIFFGLSLRPVYVTYRKDIYYSHVLFIRLIFGAMGLVCVSILALVAGNGQVGLFAVMGFYKLMELLVDIRIAYFQRHGRIGLMAVSRIFLTLIANGSLIVVFAIGRDLFISVLIAGIASLVVFGCLSAIGPNDSRAPRRIPEWGTVRVFVRDGLMLSGSAFAVSMGTSVPVLFLGAFHSTAAVGIYSAIYNISTVSNILYASVAQLVLKPFSDLASNLQFDALQRRGRRASLLLSLVGVFGAVCVYVAGADLFSLIFGVDFQGHMPALMLMATTICLAPFGFILDAQLTAMQRFASQGVLSAVSLGSGVALAWLVVPELSVFGAALVPLVLMIVRNSFKVAIFRRAVRFDGMAA